MFDFSPSADLPNRPRPIAGTGLALLGFSALVLVGCGRPSEAGNGQDSTTDSTPTASADKAEEDDEFEGSLERLSKTKVLTAPVEQREMVRALSTTVNAVSEKEIEIFPRTSGVVVEIAVEEGDRVAKGDVLMRLDPRELTAALNEAKLALSEAEDSKRGLELAVIEAESVVNRALLTFDQSKKELERKESAGEGIISKNDLENLRLAMRTNESDVAAQRVAKQRAAASLASQSIAADRANLQISTAELNLSFATVEAPFDGVIATRTVRMGDLTSSSTAAFVLTDPDNVRAVVSRPQRELSFFRAAEQRARIASDDHDDSHAALDITINPEALPGETYSGSILFVSPTIDAASGQFRVTLGVQQPAADEDRSPVLPGMLLRVRIVTERHPNTLAVPKRALLREGESYFVFVADGKKARRVQVRDGFSTDDDVEVVPTEDGTLTPGDQVIVVGNRDLDDGDPIDPSLWPARQVAETAEATETSENTEADAGADSESATDGSESATDGSESATGDSESTTEEEAVGAPEPEAQPATTTEDDAAPAETTQGNDDA